jgi:Protein of unknown function (DUF3574)
MGDRAHPLLVSCIALLGACTVPAPQSCPGGQQGMIAEYLYFGTAKPEGQVSADDWKKFLDEVVTPKFPLGLSAWQASGQWKSAAGPVIREPSYVLSLIHENSEASDAAIVAIVRAYKTRFRQEAVLRVQGPACVSF